MPRQYTPRIEMICPQCGKPFTRQPNDLKRPSKNRYCSSACRAAALRTGEVRICPGCSKKFYSPGYDINVGIVCCSATCRSRHFRGELTPNWKGGRWLANGYWHVHAHEHPNADTQGRIAEHRLIMSQHLGRTLLRTEHVHHINGNKTDNRIENLQLMSESEHHRLHGANGRWCMQFDACIDCGTTDRRHMGRGRCSRCWKRHKKLHLRQTPSSTGEPQSMP